MMKKSLVALGLGLGGILFSPIIQAKTTVIRNGMLSLEFDSKLHSKLSFSGQESSAGFRPTDFLHIENEGVEKKLQDFHRDEDQEVVKRSVRHKKFGQGAVYLLKGESQGFEKRVEITTYDSLPQVALFHVSYRNMSHQSAKILGWTNHRYALKANSFDKPAFWSYQSGTSGWVEYEEGLYKPFDWIRPVAIGDDENETTKGNYTGPVETHDDFRGGAIPVVDIWRSDMGIAVGVIEPRMTLVSLPVTRTNQSPQLAHLEVSYSEGVQVLKPGQVLSTYRTFVMAHKKDHFSALKVFSRIMQDAGVKMPEFPATSYEPIWCSWGYGRDDGFNVKYIKEAVLKAKELGYKWVVIDDGWQKAVGDWTENPDRFTDMMMADLVSFIHAQGMKAKLWWAPFAIDSENDRLVEEFSDSFFMIKDKENQSKVRRAYIDWWNAYYLDTTLPKVKNQVRAEVKRFMETWGFDGLKIDGHYFNIQPLCVDEKHDHDSPFETFAKTPDIFKDIYVMARQYKPDAVVEFCPCATGYNYFTMPYNNQPVASDPAGARQVRMKGKSIKALMGGDAPYYADHVELLQDDYASAVGIGAVLGSKFTLPQHSWQDKPTFPHPDDMNPYEEGATDLVHKGIRRDITMKKWLDIYLEKQLAKGQYLGHLYDFGYDKPEAHVVQKNGLMHYAFFNDGLWKGPVELRGLDARAWYQIVDYVNGKKLGRPLQADDQGNLSLEMRFENNILVEAQPVAM